MPAETRVVERYHGVGRNNREGDQRVQCSGGEKGKPGSREVVKTRDQHRRRRGEDGQKKKKKKNNKDV